MPNDNRVIVAGAGPVGAVLTLALAKKGIPVTLIEQLPDAAEDQRAATVHRRRSRCWSTSGWKRRLSKEPTGGMSAPLFPFRDRATGELFAISTSACWTARSAIRSCCNGNSTS